MSRFRGRSAGARTGTSATGKRLQTIGLFVTLLVVAVLVGSLAAGLMRGRTAAPAAEGAHGVTEAAEPGGAPKPAGRVRVEVLNASGVPGLAAKGRTMLRERGFDVVYVGNASGFEPDTSLVLDRVGRMELARSVADEMAIPRVYPRPDSNVFVDVTVVLGKDWVVSADSTPEAEPEQSSWTPDQSCTTGHLADVRLASASGMADSLAGRTIPVEQLRAMFGLDP